MRNRRGKFIAVILLVSLCIIQLNSYSSTVFAETETVHLVSTVEELRNAVSTANESSTKDMIILTEGTYIIDEMMHITSDYLTIKSETGDYNDVTIKGQGMYGSVSHIFLVSSSDFTVSGLNLGQVSNHVIQVQGEKGASNFSALNCRFYDAFEQLLKVSKGSEDGMTSSNGLVDGCLFEYTKGIGPQYYIGGVDAHRATNWIIRNNTFEDIKSPEDSLAEHAIHFWSGSSGTLVENNKIVDCDRGIGFGLGTSTHEGGNIRYNYVYTTRDVGIGLENASNVTVHGNTVYTKNYTNSIEYRFEGTSGDIYDNTVSANIEERNGGLATVWDNRHLESGEWNIGVDGLPVLHETPTFWAVDGIDWLKENSLIRESMYSNYTGNINREDFAYLVVYLYEELSGESAPEVDEYDQYTFTDTTDEYVIKAYKLGIIKGYGDKEFGPKDSVTREQVAVMLIRAMKEAGMDLNSDGVELLTFADEDEMSDWAIDSIRMANKHGIMNGVGDGIMEPKANTTREQGLILVYNIITKQDDFEVALLEEED